MITLTDVQAAANRIAPYVLRTPLEKNRTLSELLGTNVYIKIELFQKTGSFKARGAFNQILQLEGANQVPGVVAVSGGNFAQGVAYAAKHLGIPAIICMPTYTPTNYVEATRGYGARVEFAPDLVGCFALAEAFKAEGYAALHAWDNPNQMAGNGTAGMEIVESLPEITDIIISVGGGGLLAGNTVAVKALKPSIRVWAVETEGSPTLGKALEAGKPVTITPNSLAKTLGAPYIAADALTLAQTQIAGYVVVSDEEAVHAQRFILERTKLLTELAASCTLAAAQKIKHHFQPEDHVVLLFCGGNDSLANMLNYAQKYGHG